MRIFSGVINGAAWPPRIFSAGPTGATKLEEGTCIFGRFHAAVAVAALAGALGAAPPAAADHPALEVYPGATNINGEYFTQEEGRKVAEWYVARYPEQEGHEQPEIIDGATVEVGVSRTVGIDAFETVAYFANVREEKLKSIGGLKKCKTWNGFNWLHAIAEKGESTHDMAEFEALCEKYSFVAHAQYPLTEKGGTERIDAAIDKRYFKMMGDEADNQKQAGIAQGEIQQKIALAAQRGDMAEMQKLAKQLRGAQNQQQAATAKGPTPDEKWDHWVSFLEELGQHGYRTRIQISPSPH